MSDKTFRSIFEGKQDEAEKYIDIEHGLLAKLLAHKVITDIHRDAISVRIICYCW